MAESVFIAGMFVKYGQEYADLCGHRGLADEAAAARESIARVEQAALTAGWDGEWFRRAYDAFGKPVGSKECDEGQIFIEPQGMCVMAGIGKETGQAAQALKSVEERLDTKYGVVLHAACLHHLPASTWAKFPAILRDTRKTPASSATTTPGSAVPKRCWATATGPLRFTARPVPAYIEDISRNSPHGTLRLQPDGGR